MKIYPAVHYTMGGLWVDYNLMSNVPGLFVLGEANFSDHGANRLGASALMQGLADGYFIAPHAISNYLASNKFDDISINHEAFEEATSSISKFCNQLLDIKGSNTVDDLHKRLGKIMWNSVGMSRNKEGLEKALKDILALKEEFYNTINIPGTKEFNAELEKAGRLADFLGLGELMALDALKRDESCGGHFREEYQTDENEALRNDTDFSYVAAWEHKKNVQDSVLHKEDLEFENVKLTNRSYK